MTLLSYCSNDHRGSLFIQKAVALAGAAKAVALAGAARAVALAGAALLITLSHCIWLREIAWVEATRAQIAADFILEKVKFI